MSQGVFSEQWCHGFKEEFKKRIPINLYVFYYILVFNMVRRVTYVLEKIALGFKFLTCLNHRSAFHINKIRY